MQQYDTIVIGGGLSGLMAARKLHKSGKNVIVLEARDRVGGRNYTQTVTLDRPTKTGETSCSLDMGGMWMGAHQPRLMGLVAELGIPFFDCYGKGKNVLELNGNRCTQDSLLPSLSSFLSHCNELASPINPKAPWSSPNATEYDSKTVQTLMDQEHWTGPLGNLFKVAISGLYTADVEEMSLLYFLFYIKSAGSVDFLINTEGGAQQWLFEGGAQQLSEKVATQMGEGHVRLGAVVTSVKYGVGGVRVTTADGLSVLGRNCVVALPPAMCMRILFEPPLPGSKNQFHQRVPMGSIIKIHIVYEEAWWRKKGYSGVILSDKGPLYWCADEGPPEGYIHKDSNLCMLPSIVGFLTGKYCLEWDKYTQEERKKAILEQMAICFESDEAWDILGYYECDWRSEQFSGGCFVGFMPPGVLTKYGDIMRQPVGPLHWASTELATSWCGYMEGAIDSGERAADEILQINQGAKL